MKTTRCAVRLLWCWSLAAMGGVSSALAETSEKLMTQGKLAADLGDWNGAERAFDALAADAAAPGNARVEALVRLGVARRALGNTRASTAAFQKAMQSRARDAEVTRLLTLAVGGVALDHKRWASEWPKVRLGAATSGTGSRPFIEWPGPGPQGVRQAFPAQDPVTLDLEDVALVPLLRHLLAGWRPGENGGPRTSQGFENWPDTYRTPAALDELDFVIHAAVQGHDIRVDPEAGPHVTVKAAGMPWNELFENLLASNGLGFTLDKNLLFIARVEDLAAFERIRGREYAGWPVSLNFLTANLLPDRVLAGDPGDKQTWKIVPDVGLLLHLADAWPGFQFEPDTTVRGTVTLRVRERPILQVLDLFLVSNDLAAVRIERPPAKAGTIGLRVCRLADAGGKALDLSALPPPPRP